VTRFVPAWSVHLARESGFIQMPFVLAACDGTASPVKFAVFCAGTIVAWAAIVFFNEPKRPSIVLPSDDTFGADSR